MTAGTKPKTPKPHLAYGQAILAGIKKTGIERRELAARAGVDYVFLNLCIGGYKPVPPKYAPIISDLLGIKPEDVCAAYEPIEKAAKATNMPLGTNDAKSAQNARLKRLEGEVLALSGIVASLTLAMMRHRPAEAQDVLRMLESRLTDSERESPLIQRILQTLRQDEKQK